MNGKPSLAWSLRTAFPVQAVEFSPASGGRVVAIGSSANFGFYPRSTDNVGGMITVADSSGKGVQFCTTQAGVYDVAWGSLPSSLLLVAMNDGSVSIFDDASSVLTPRVVLSLKRHSIEASSVAWSTVSPRTAASCSWDGLCHFYPDISRPDAVDVLRLTPLAEHSADGKRELHCVRFSRHFPPLLVTAASSGHAVLIDSRAQQQPAAVISHGSECLCADFVPNLDQFLVATAGADGSIALWDTRKADLRYPISRSQVHSWGIRQFKLAPVGFNSGSRSRMAGAADVVSASYDMTSVVSRIPLRAASTTAHSALPRRLEIQHSEFAFAVDWSDDGGSVASAGWDRRVLVYRMGSNLAQGKL
jgi:WD40 repeat protein